jgi:hypothetical protein
MSEVSEPHERYGHISFDTLKSLPECLKFHTKPRCEACEKGKATKPSTKKPPEKSSKDLNYTTSRKAPCRPSMTNQAYNAW